jgi:non-canonical purine NTP pyrophosphatase (RdgB/HAM1 family)
VLASRNQGKTGEIQAMLADLGISLFSLKDYPEIPEIVEDGKSFLENALKKGRTVAEATGEIVLADDSGLEVDALRGAPGIYSARYAGNDADDLQNNRKLHIEERHSGAFWVSIFQTAIMRPLRGVGKGGLRKRLSGKADSDMTRSFFSPERG